MLNRSAKKSQVAKLSDNFSRSKASFLVNCIGLNVEQMTELRKSLKQNQGDIQVIRNSLSLRAMESSEILKSTYGPQLEGPNAFVLAFEDSTKVAKIIDQFSKDHKIFQIKGAVLDGAALSKEEVKALANLPPQDVLRAQFLRLLSISLVQLLSTVKEVPQGFVRLLSKGKEKRESA